MRTHSSRNYKSKEPRVTFAVPDENYDSPTLQENIQPNKDFQYDSFKTKKSTTPSLASKFSKRWERITTDDFSPYNYQYPQESKNKQIPQDIPEISQDSESLILSKPYNYDNVSEVENSDETCDDIPRAIMMNRTQSNQSAEVIKQNIDLLVNRVREICNKK